MLGRLIVWLSLCIATAAAFPAVNLLTGEAPASMQQTGREIDRDLRGYFAREFHNSAF